VYTAGWLCEKPAVDLQIKIAKKKYIIIFAHYKKRAQLVNTVGLVSSVGGGLIHHDHVYTATS